MSSDRLAPWSLEEGGVALWLRLTPKGGRDAIDGVETLADGRAVLKARVRAAPEDGRANAALIELIAKALAAPKKAVAIRSGETSRLKKLFIAGDPAPYLDALARLAPNNG
ncbi:MAG: hypothetical protein CTY15_12280 [Methylocystis sp.]|nr:MAG: hypothetical protein CTY15_12280 [Methylocystis sp.]